MPSQLRNNRILINVIITLALAVSAGCTCTHQKPLPKPTQRPECDGQEMNAAIRQLEQDMRSSIKDAKGFLSGEIQEMEKRLDERIGTLEPEPSGIKPHSHEKLASILVSMESVNDSIKSIDSKIARVETRLSENIVSVEASLKEKWTNEEAQLDEKSKEIKLMINGLESNIAELKGNIAAIQSGLEDIKREIEDARWWALGLVGTLLVGLVGPWPFVWKRLSNDSR